MPEFYSDQQYFTVTLMNKNYGESETTEKTENRILTLFINNLGIIQKEISKQLGDITIDGVRYNMKKLKNKGIISRIGPDKGGYWQIEEDFKKNK